MEHQFSHSVIARPPVICKKYGIPAFENIHLRIGRGNLQPMKNHLNFHHRIMGEV
jgi:hypothetical protein